MHRPTLATGIVAAASLVLCQAAGAALVDRGNGMIYDTTRNITWLANADLFGTQFNANPNLPDQIIAAMPTVFDGYNTHTLTRQDFGLFGGPQSAIATWYGAMAWAQTLVYGGFSDWRLPTSLQPDPACSQQGQFPDFSYGTNCRGSELGHLYYDELGGMANMQLATVHNANYDLFTNIEFDYWTGTTILFGTQAQAWYFTTSGGYQTYLSTQPDYVRYAHAWAVRDGDVAAAPPNGSIPEPGVVALLGIGLVGACAMRRTGRWRKR